MISLWVAFSAVGVLLIFDLYQRIKNGDRATISVELYAFSRKYPIVPFLVGMLMGHLFWKQ